MSIWTRNRIYSISSPSTTTVCTLLQAPHWHVLKDRSFLLICFSDQESKNLFLEHCYVFNNAMHHTPSTFYLEKRDDCVPRLIAHKPRAMRVPTFDFSFPATARVHVLDGIDSMFIELIDILEHYNSSIKLNYFYKALDAKLNCSVLDILLRNMDTRQSPNRNEMKDVLEKYEEMKDEIEVLSAQQQKQPCMCDLCYISQSMKKYK
jgi:hypothetical protein